LRTLLDQEDAMNLGDAAPLGIALLELRLGMQPIPTT
jgi:hypothetical protein